MPPLVLAPWPPVMPAAPPATLSAVVGPRYQHELSVPVAQAAFDDGTGKPAADAKYARKLAEAYKQAPHRK